MRIVRIKKGFTLIEVMVTIAILLIALGIVSPIFNYNLNMLYNTENKNDLQREAQYAMKCFTQSSMEAQNITVVDDGGGSILDNTVSGGDGTSIKEIEFSTSNTDTSYNGTVSHNFTLLDDKTLTYTKKVTTESAITGDVTILQQTSSNIANNVESIEIKPSTDGIAFKDAIGLIITMRFVKGSQEYSIKSNVYFRNSNN